MYDCISQGEIGSRCSADNQCDLAYNLACDIQPAGGQSFSCSRLQGSICNYYNFSSIFIFLLIQIWLYIGNSFKQCVNNLDCIKTTFGQAYCGCQVNI